MREIVLLFISSCVLCAFGTSVHGYNPPDSVQSLSSVRDIDGNVYVTVKIGNQIWMAENLRTTKYANGDLIPQIIDAKEWAYANVGAFCWYDNQGSFDVPYGKLYNWYAVSDSRNLCPTGWHVPTDGEWQLLLDFLGGNLHAGSKMTPPTVTYRVKEDKGNANIGFSGVPGGFRDVFNKEDNNFHVRQALGQPEPEPVKESKFRNMREVSWWWTSTEHRWTGRLAYLNDTGADARMKSLEFGEASVSGGGFGVNDGMSVRCIRD